MENFFRKSEILSEFIVLMNFKNRHKVVANFNTILIETMVEKDVKIEASLTNIASYRSTDLGNLIGNTQCENFRFFLPFRSYVKSIMVTLKPQKLPF